MVHPDEGWVYISATRCNLAFGCEEAVGVVVVALTATGESNREDFMKRW